MLEQQIQQKKEPWKISKVKSKEEILLECKLEFIKENPFIPREAATFEEIFEERIRYLKEIEDYADTEYCKQWDAWWDKTPNW